MWRHKQGGKPQDVAPVAWRRRRSRVWYIPRARHVTLYTKKGLLKKVSKFAGVAEHLGAIVSDVRETYDAYNKAAKAFAPRLCGHHSALFLAFLPACMHAFMLLWGLRVCILCMHV